MPNRFNNFNFINFTTLSDDEAKDLVGDLRKIVLKAERDRETELSEAEDSMAIWKNQFWSEEDIDYYEEKFNVSPYNIPAARGPLNRLVNEWRSNRYEFNILPDDKFSIERHRKNAEKFVEEHYDEFDTPEQARDYFERYADDELAQAVSIKLDKIRDKQKAKYVDSQVIENAIITGVDFFKTTYSKKDNPDGEIKYERKSIRQMLWDHASVDPLLQDVEYIGEVNRLYKKDLINLFPENKDQIEDRFKSYSQFMRGMGQYHFEGNWRDYFDFEQDQTEGQVKVVDLWFRDNEERFQLVHKQTGEPRLVKHGLKEDQIWDKLKEIKTEDLWNEFKNTKDRQRKRQIQGFFNGSKREVADKIEKLVRNEFELRTTQATVWKKAVFTHNALLELKRNPLIHGSHPYTPAFVQFTEGWWTSVVGDIRDLLLAYNKAVMFREIMMANSAKGVLVVDRNAVNKAGYSIDDISEMWTEVGGVIDLKLTGGRRLQDVFQSVTTIGEGLAEIKSVIDEIEAKIFRTIGINEAMMGFVGNEAAASQVRQRIQQGVGTNGVIFDNFNRALETHTHEKVIPLVVAELASKKPKVIRDLSENRSRWVELTYDKEFELFVDAIMSGDYQTKLQTAPTDQQIAQQWSAMLLEMAQARPDAIDIEAVLEFTEMPFVHDFLRRNRQLKRRKQRDRALRRIDIGEIRQIMAEQGVDEDMAEKLLKQIRKRRAQQLKNENGNQQGQGTQTVKQLAGEAKRQQNIETAALTGRSEGN